MLTALTYHKAFKNTIINTDLARVVIMFGEIAIALFIISSIVKHYAPQAVQAYRILFGIGVGMAIVATPLFAALGCQWLDNRRADMYRGHRH